MSPIHDRASMAELLSEASAIESRRAFWHARFAHLLTSGVLSSIESPARQFSVRLPPGPTDAAIAFCRRAVFDAVRAGIAVCIDVDAAGRGDERDWFGRLSAGLGSALAQERLQTRHLLFSVSAEHPALGRVLALRRSPGLGRPGVAVRYDLRSTHASHWPKVVAASHGDGRILPVPRPGARPLSGLHGCEDMHTVMPRSLFAAPPESAWMVLNLDARRLGTPGQTRRTLADCLRLADNLIDVLRWPRASLRLDALLNRRVAINVQHVGTSWGTAPAGLGPRESYARLRRRILFVRRAIVRASVLLARERGAFPELCVKDLAAHIEYRYGSMNARRLLGSRVLRHRHLFALSPFALSACANVSRHAGETAQWVRQIPVIGSADAISMCGSEQRSGLSLVDWAECLRLTAAVAADNVKTNSGSDSVIRAARGRA